MQGLIIDKYIFKTLYYNFTDVCVKGVPLWIMQQISIFSHPRKT